MYSQSIMRTGTDDPPPVQTPLHAGPLSLIYENGDLRYIRLGERELVRRVYVAVRDHNWDTIPAVLTDFEMEVSDASFAISYTAHHRRGDVDFRWAATIRGTTDGAIEFHMDGQVLSTFRRNRIGFCVLHPMSCSGDGAVIEHTDGSLEESHFPRQIAPQMEVDGSIRPVYPFADMRTLSHQVTPELAAKVAFSGDIFEMEDQRNWTDASYKTYSTPLEMPFPVKVTAGTKIAQSVTLTLQGDFESSQPASTGTRERDGEAVTLVVHPERIQPLPAIGLGVASHGQPLTAREIEALLALNLRHLRVDLRLSEPDFVEQLGRATTQAAALDVNLEAAIFVSDAAAEELADLRRHLAILAPRIGRWLVFHEDEKSTSARWVDLAREHLATYDLSARFGAGSNAYFTEINRERPETSNLDFIAYSLNPQVHAFDNSSLVETLEAQAVTVESSRHFAYGKDIVVSPVTLLPRFNPNATGPEAEPAPDQLPPQVDVRQMSLFGAAWTLGSLKYLLGSGVDAVTYYETTGWRGVMEAESGSPRPEKFHSEAGMVFPLYHVLADVGKFVGGEVVEVTTSDALRIDGFAMRSGGRLAVLVANLSPHVQRVRIEGVASAGPVRMLDEGSYASATNAPEIFRSEEESPGVMEDDMINVELPPFAYARLEYRLPHQSA